MYPKRLILDDARQFGIEVLGLDVNASEKEYVVEGTDPENEHSGYGIRLALAEVKGISEAEVSRIVAARPYHSLTDFWHRARVSRPIVERLVLAGGFDSVYGIGALLSGLPGHGVRRRGKVTRRDLLLQVADLDRHSRAVDPSTGSGRRRASKGRGRGLPSSRGRDPGVWEKASAQSQATRPVAPVTSVQLVLDLGDTPGEGEVSGLPEMNASERVRAELEILGLDVSRHVVDFYSPFLDALGVIRSRDLLRQRSRSELLIAGVKVATQTPPIRSGRRVIFLTLDDATGPVDATFFEDAQGPYAATVFHSWLLLVRGVLRRTGRRGISLRATGCWELPALHQVWQLGGPDGGIDGVREMMAQVPAGFATDGITEGAVQGAAASRSSRPVVAGPDLTPGDADDQESVDGRGMTAGGMGRRRVLVHSSGFKMSPYSDIKPAGDDTKTAPRKLWHRSPGSAG